MAEEICKDLTFMVVVVVVVLGGLCFDQHKF